MDAEAIAEGMKHLPDGKFRFRVLAPVRYHVPAAPVADALER
jgi:hypothetical protein